jgi:hypothetical protein
MAEINKENLEKAVGDKGIKNQTSNENNSQGKQMSKEMEIGFHQGAMNTLVNERNELIKMAQMTERIMQGHMKRLEELGIKIQTQKDSQEKQDKK